VQFHGIRVVDQSDLPAGHEWALVEHDEQITLFITEAALTPRALEGAWAGYRLLTAPRHPARVPPPRMGSPLFLSA
jgi:hypothetical protein